MEQEAIEIELWEYIDGLCDQHEMERISNLIATEELWRMTYNDLLTAHKAIQSQLELEQPGLRFSKNVMDAVAVVPIAPATKKYINTRIIQAIAAVFILMLVTLLGYAFAHAQWNGASNYDWRKTISSSLPSTPVSFGLMSKTAILINLVLALVLIDKLIRHRKDQSGGKLGHR